MAMYSKEGFKVYPASIVDDDIRLEVKRCRAYRLLPDNTLKLIAAGAYSTVTTLDMRRYRLYELYLKTFFGEFNAPMNYDNDLPEYDLLHAKFKYEKTRIFINDTEFKAIPGYFGYYVTANGVVYSILRNIIFKHRIDKDGYHKVDIYPREEGSFRAENGSKSQIKLVHHLVYLAWINPVIPDGYIIHHKDSVKWHNYADNLELATPLENYEYAVADGLLWKRPVGFKWGPDEVETVCKMMSENAPMYKIALALGVKREDDPYSYSKLCQKVQYIKRGIQQNRHGLFWKIIEKYPKAGEYTWNTGDMVSTFYLNKKYFPAERRYGYIENKREVADRFTQEEIDNMKFENSMGVTFAEIGRRHGISLSSALRLVRGINVKKENGLGSTTIERVSDQ